MKPAKTKWDIVIGAVILATGSASFTEKPSLLALIVVVIGAGLLAFGLYRPTQFED